MHKLFLCLRYLRKRRIAFFGVAAVALCVALLIVITSLFSGFINAYVLYSQRFWGQVVLVTPPLADYASLVQYLEDQDDIVTAKAKIETGGLLYLGRGDVRAVEVLGVDLNRCLREEYFSNGLLLNEPEGEKAGFVLPEAAREKARQWLAAKLNQPITDEQLPIPAILGIGLVGKPDELTDEYNRAAIRDELANWDMPMALTVAQQKLSLSELDDMAPKKKRIQCWPINVLQIGHYEIDKATVYLPFEQVQKLVGSPGPDGQQRCLATVEITARPGAAADVVKEHAEQAWRSYAATHLDWPSERIDRAMVYVSSELPNVRLMVGAIKQQLAIMQLMVGLICLVVALLVFVILFMMVMQKKRDIGIIRGLGTTRTAVAGIFIGFGAGIGLAGSALGLILGAWATQHISLVESAVTRLLGFKIWKSGVYMFSEIPSEVAWSAVGWIVAAGVAAAVLGALLPAVRAARLRPVEALRYE